MTGKRPEEFIRPLAEVEKDAIVQAMILCRGSYVKASRRLKISRATLFRKLKSYADEEPSE